MPVVQPRWGVAALQYSAACQKGCVVTGNDTFKTACLAAKSRPAQSAAHGIRQHLPLSLANSLPGCTTAAVLYATAYHTNSKTCCARHPGVDHTPTLPCSPTTIPPNGLTVHNHDQTARQQAFCILNTALPQGRTNCRPVG